MDGNAGSPPFVRTKADGMFAAVLRFRLGVRWGGTEAQLWLGGEGA